MNDLKKPWWQVWEEGKLPETGPQEAERWVITIALIVAFLFGLVTGIYLA